MEGRADFPLVLLHFLGLSGPIVPFTGSVRMPFPMRILGRVSICALTAISVLAAPPVPEKKPKLVLAIVIDQFRYDYLLRFGNEYRYGLARLTKQGAVFTDAHYLHAVTVTAVGHSTFLSGAPPARSGIV